METTSSIPETKKRLNWQAPFKRLMDNPVIIKELRGRMRGRQAFILLTIYLALIGFFIVIVYNLLDLTSSITWNPSARQDAGKAIFGTVVLLELLLISFIAPGLTAGAITSERERQTFEILRTTLLSARSLVLGKLGSAFSYLFLLILTALPIQSLAFLLGGVGLGEMIASSLMLVVTAIFYCTLGIFFSSILKRTLPATVSSYAVILLSFLLLVVIFFLIAYIESISSSTFGARAIENLLTMILWFLISTNPMMAAVLSEVILVDQQSLFFTNRSMFGGSGPSFLPSPWLIYVAVYLLMTAVLILLSIYFVKRPDR
jgi:ABC-type transport system involved in multi-copper enzyme maturation permease subunit